MKRNVLLAILAVLAVCVCAGVYFYLQEDGVSLRPPPSR